jgi:ABC-type lipoprotein export system ATPase subunit
VASIFAGTTPSTHSSDGRGVALPEGEMQPLLRFEGVSKTYHRGSESIHALEKVSFDVGAGDFVVVTGPSGSGKSTLLHVAAGLDEPDEGSVLFEGIDIYSYSARERAKFRRRKLGFVFQFFNLVPTLNAVQNVSLPLLLDGISKNSADAKAEELLTQLGMAHRLHHKPNEMSGGQMQRVAVARALIADPPLILADEPTGNLDSETGEEVLRLLKEAAAQHGAAVILVTHDPEAAGIGDRRVAIHDGRILTAVEG